MLLSNTYAANPTPRESPAAYKQQGHLLHASFRMDSLESLPCDYALNIAGFWWPRQRHLSRTIGNSIRFVLDFSAYARSTWPR